MERQRLLLAIVLSFLVIYGYQVLFPPSRPKPTPPAAPGPQAPAEVAQPAVEAPSVSAPPVVASDREQDVAVESDAVHAVFTTRGGVLKSWRLKRYHDTTGEPLDLVPQTLPGHALPFTLEVDDPATTGTLKQALFKPNVDALVVGRSPSSLVFEYRDASGLTARKEFAFSAAQPYVIRFTADVTRNGQAQNPFVRWGPALGTGIIGGGMTYNPPPQPIFYRDGRVTRVAIKNIEQHRESEGGFGFAGVDDHYFLSAILPSAQPIRLKYEPLTFPAKDKLPGRQFIDWSARAASAPASIDYFFGPKDLDILKSVRPELVRAIDFGMFDWLVVPLLRALKWVDGYIGNYGWSIIALTILINLVMFPLRHKSVVSMRKMQEIQPEVKAIQDRYAKLKISDPARQKMNVELMTLYRERGANPATGCIPMLLTLPVLFAFYAMLSVAIELRGAPFVGWIKDLSVHDPYFVTPVLMGITQFVQTRMTPTSADPVQQRMMMFMPVMFTAMLMWAPSGLVLYWTVSNLWAIGQQVVTNRLIGPPPQHVVRPPAERRIKNAGAGKSGQAAKEQK
jgi:YidC/Oxa1 family membrane protein insertase